MISRIIAITSYSPSEHCVDRTEDHNEHRKEEDEAINEFLLGRLSAGLVVEHCGEDESNWGAGERADDREERLQLVVDD